MLTVSSDMQTASQRSEKVVSQPSRDALTLQTQLIWIEASYLHVALRRERPGPKFTKTEASAAILRSLA